MMFESIHDFFSRVAGERGDEVAISRSGEEMTYVELEEGSNRLANALLSGGLKAGDRVVLLVDDRFRAITAILAALKAGGVFVPLDPATPQQRLQGIAAEVEPTWLLGEAAFLEALAGMASAGAKVLCLDPAPDMPPIELVSYDPAGDSTHPEISRDPDDMAYITYTSGSTGQPKGIMGRLKSIDHFIRWEIEEFGLEAGCRVSQLTTPSFDAFLRDVFVPLCAGGTVCIPADRETVLDAGKLVDWIDLEEIEVIHCVPSLFRTLFNSDLDEDYFESLRYVLLAGEPLLASDVSRWYDLFSDRGQLVNLYGPSETTMTKFFHRVAPEDVERSSIPIGKPMPGVQALVMGPNHKPRPQGTVGEIYIRTPYRTLGYYNLPGLTAEVFLQNPFTEDPDDLIYRTGDLGRQLEDGNFEFLGRKDTQIKIRGVRIELGEIESLLLSHEAVAEAAVNNFGAEGGEKTLVAYVVCSGEVEISELRDFLGIRLSEVMVPGRFVRLDELPRTLSGKIDRKALPAPDGDRSDLESTFVAPRSLTEEMLSGIWTELLGVPKIGIHHSFFEVGGHSLLATQLLSRIRTSFNVALPLNLLFDAPTIAGLAKGIETTQKSEGGIDLPPFRRVPRDRKPPLSFAQQRLWFLDRLEPGNPAYNVAHALALNGNLGVGIMHRALDEIARRHESLRTTFSVSQGHPVQVIAPPGPTSFPLVDLTALPGERRTDERRRLYHRQCLRPFVLDHDVLLRTVLVKEEESSHVLLIIFHHIISDAWSSGLMLREWMALYNAFHRGLPSPLKELPIQPGDYAWWEHSWLGGEAREQLLAYWRRQLEGIPAALELPTDRPRPPVQGAAGGVEFLRFSRRTREDLEALGRHDSTTLFMALFALFQVLLGRLSGQRDFAVGTPTAGRGHSELEGLLGFFVNPLVLRADLSGNPSFHELLFRVRKVVLEALAHQELPFEMLVEELQPERDRSRAPLYQVAFGVQNVPQPDANVVGLELAAADHPATTAKLDLDLNMGEASEGTLGGSLEYSAELYDATTIRRIVNQFQRLTQEVLEAPERNIWELSLLSSSAQHQLLHEWNDTDLSETNEGLVEALARHVAGRPEASAVECGQECLTYAKLDRLSNRLANYLITMGVGPEVIVGLSLERTPRLVVAIVAVFKAGAVYLPLDSSYPSDRLSFMMEDSGLSLLVTEDSVANTLPTHFGFTVHLDADEDMIEAADEGAPEVDFDPERSAYIIYTSGSTGQPKGARLRHRGLANILVEGRRVHAVGPKSRVLQFAALGFDASVFEITSTLYAGATLVMAPREDLMPSPAFLKLLEQLEVTHVTLPPSVLAVLPAPDLPKLETLIVAGEACSSEQVDRWAPGRRFINAYGPTEATVWSSYELCHAGGSRPRIGRPIGNTRIYLLDDDKRPVPTGSVGTLHIAGIGLAAEYLNRPGLTEERFFEHAVAGSGRLYNSGDLARWHSDGSLEFLGRADHQVKIRAFRIELGEIEEALRRHPNVSETLVVAWGKAGEQRLVAYVVTPEKVEDDELSGFLAESLPEYMIPSFFLRLDAMPLNPSGKVDRKALPDPQMDQLGSDELLIDPRNPMEETIATIWCEVLDRERVGVRNNFFGLGGYSLAATQVLVRIRDLFGVELDLSRFFDKPTVESLAWDLDRALEEGRVAPAPPLVPQEGQEEYPLSFAQEVVWEAEQRTPGNYFEHVPSALKLRGDLDTAALKRTLQEIWRRHESLRTVFTNKGDQVMQRILPADEIPMPQTDLEPFGEEKEAQFGVLAREQVQAPFDLEKGPLARCHLFRMAEGEHILLLICHHIVIDQWSAGIFLRELALLYEAFRAGQPSPLAELPVQYADFAVWERIWLRGDVLDTFTEYWKNQLRGAEPLELPTDHPRSEEVFVPLGRHTVVLDPEISAALHQLSRSRSATLFMTLLAVWKGVLLEWTGNSDISLTFPIANRKRREVEPLLGFFPNMLVLRTDVSGDPTFEELLTRVRKVTLGAFSNQNLPFEKMLETVSEVSNLSRGSFRVSCNFYNAPMEPQPLPGLEMSSVDVGIDIVRSDLVLLFQDDSAGIVVSFAYRDELFEPETIAGIAERFEQLGAAAVAEPERVLSQLLAGETIEH